MAAWGKVSTVCFDNGFDEAEKHAEAFRAKTGLFRALLQEKDDREALSSLDTLV